MQAQKGKGRSNALRGELTVRLEETSRAPAEAVYDLLADISSHLEWGGRRQPRKTYRLLSVDASEGPATVGTEFGSTGADGMGTFADTSVVTEATRPSLFEFVTEARLSTKRGRIAEWTNVHRYEIAPGDDGCRITYTVRILRISELPGMLTVFKIPGLRALGLKVGGSNSRKGLRGLARLAEERAQARRS